MLSMIPPSHWSKTFAATPAQLLAAVPNDYTDLIQLVWNNATVNARDAEWAEAFVRLGDTGKHPRINEHLIKLLPEERRHEVTYELLSTNNLSEETILEMLDGGSLDERSARLLIKRIADRARGLRTNYDHELATLLPRLAIAAPPQLLSEFESAWPVENFEAAKKAYEQFFTGCRHK